MKTMIRGILLGFLYSFLIILIVLGLFLARVWIVENEQYKKTCEKEMFCYYIDDGGGILGSDTKIYVDCSLNLPLSVEMRKEDVCKYERR